MYQEKGKKERKAGTSLMEGVGLMVGVSYTSLKSRIISWGF